MDQNGMSNSHRGPSIDVSIMFQSRRFLEIDQSETIIAWVLYRDCSFHFDPLINMAATGNPFF
jgi:hypothetical protein